MNKILDSEKFTNRIHDFMAREFVGRGKSNPKTKARFLKTCIFLAENHEVHGLGEIGKVCRLSDRIKPTTLTLKRLLNNLIAAKIVTVSREAVYVDRIERVLENHRYTLRLCDDLYKD